MNSYTLDNITTTLPASARSLWRDPLLWFVLAVFFVGGLVYNSLPVTFPVFKLVFKATPEKMGLIQYAFFSGGLLFSLVGGQIICWLGLRRTGIVALACLAAALVVIGSAPNLPVTVLGACGFGLAILATVTLGNATINEHFQNRRQRIFSLAGLIVACGGIAGPAVLGWWFTNADHWATRWRIGYYGAAAIFAGLVRWAFLLRSVFVLDEDASLRDTAVSSSAFRDILRQPGACDLALVHLLHGIAQGGMLSIVGQTLSEAASNWRGRSGVFHYCQLCRRHLRPLGLVLDHNALERL